MEPTLLPNFGIHQKIIPQSLYLPLLRECKKAEKKNPKMISGLTGKGVAPHYYITNPTNLRLLKKYLQEMKREYDTAFPGLGETGVLSKSLNYKCDSPWINIQRKGQLLPIHTHDGIYSYTIWMQIPYDIKEERADSGCAGVFEFHYSTIFGAPMAYSIPLSKKNEGTIIMFPAKLKHCVYPFYTSSKTRISIAGNLLYDAG